MAIRKTEAIVLRTQPFRSTSLVVTFFSKDSGKIRGLAKGVRQEREVRGAVFELFTQLEVVYYEKTRSDLHLISDAFILEPYASLHSRLESITYASYFAELVNEVSEVHDPHPEIFELLDFAFQYLASIPGGKLARLFEIKLLASVGWLPQLETCLVCGKGGMERGFFSSRQGAILCGACAPQYPDARPVGAEALAALRHYAGRDLDAGLKLPVSRPAEQELEGFMNRFFTERLSRPLKSSIFLQKIRPAFS